MDSLEIGSRYVPVASCCEHGNGAFILFFLCAVNDYSVLVATNTHIILIYISPYLAGGMTLTPHPLLVPWS